MATASSGRDAALLRLLELVVENGRCQLQDILSEVVSPASFTADMRRAIGGVTDASVLRFLQKYPSLFLLSAESGGQVFVSPASCFDPSKSATSSSDTSRPLCQVEQDAVDFFRSRFFKKAADISAETTPSGDFNAPSSLGLGNLWLSIVSLAGHLSQAPQEIRRVVGPQAEFKNFLVKHPEAFIVSGSQVSLKLDRSPTVETVSLPTPSDSPAKRVPPRAGGGPLVRLSSGEYSALMLVKRLVEQTVGGVIAIADLVETFVESATVEMTILIGQTESEMLDYIKKYSSLFEFNFETGIVAIRRDARLNFLIESGATGTIRGLYQKRARVYHIAKLWGTLDLGRHEHVFFDISIFPRHEEPPPGFERAEDLRRRFKTNDFASFTAVLAPPTSRAKWRATCVWPINERPPTDAYLTPMGPFAGSTGTQRTDQDVPLDESGRAAVRGTEPILMDELDWDCSNDLFLADSFIDEGDGDASCLRRRDPSPTHSEMSCLDHADALLLAGLRVPLGLPDEVRSNINLLGQFYGQQGYTIVNPSLPTELTDSSDRPSVSGSKFVDAACQTLSTGDILATRIFAPKPQVH